MQVELPLDKVVGIIGFAICSLILLATFGTTWCRGIVYFFRLLWAAKYNLIVFAAIFSVLPFSVIAFGGMDAMHHFLQLVDSPDKHPAGEKVLGFFVLIYILVSFLGIPIFFIGSLHYVHEEIKEKEAKECAEKTPRRGGRR